MNIALILASGNGTRMGKTDVPKQFLDVDGTPLMFYSVRTFQEHNLVDQIYIVTNKDYVDFVRQWCLEESFDKVIDIVPGGATRSESVENGLHAISANPNDVIIIHDSARPLVSEEIITDNILECQKYGAVVTAIPSVDTVVHSVNDFINDIPNRSEMFLEQTPQTFKYDIIKHAQSLKNQDFEITDDCKLVFESGFDIHLVKGSKRNFKITTMEDLILFKSLKK